MKKCAVIMAGGSGTRFWPKSSSKKPKQLLALTGKKTQIQLTWDRLHGIVPASQRWIICTEALASATHKQIPQAHLLKEPEGRNTMAAACWSAWAVQKKHGDALVALLPADAFVADVKGFQKALTRAYQIAEKENRIVCLGIQPTYPATSYGYIQTGSNLSEGFEIEKFVEKPQALKAQELFQSGNSYWNAGIFVFRANTFINEVRHHSPQFAAFFDKTLSKPGAFKKGYKKLKSVSVDIELMEKTRQGALVPGLFGWNDIGSWTALAEVLPQNSEAGLINAPGGHIALDSQGIIVDATGKKFIGLIGVNNLIIVETEKALLVCHKDKAQQIKDLVGLINQNKKLRKELL